MKSLRFSVLGLVLLLLPAATAFAGTDTHKGSFSIGTPAQIAGTQLAAGDYKLKWDGNGPTAQVSVIHNGKVVATVPARVQTLAQKPTQDSVAVKTNNGVRTVTLIQFDGKNYALEIGGETSGGDTASGNK
jgi:hypothetical protein